MTIQEEMNRRIEWDRWETEKREQELNRIADKIGNHLTRDEIELLIGSLKDGSYDLKDFLMKLDLFPMTIL